jgi:hypothetical protein
MRRGDPGDAQREQPLEDRLAKRRPFPRLGTGSDLVEEEQRGRIDLVEPPRHRAHVRGEGRKIRVDRLVVADVRPQLPERRDRGGRRGHRQAAVF